VIRDEKIEENPERATTLKRKKQSLSQKKHKINSKSNH